MKRANLNDKTIGLLNKALESGVDVKELSSELYSTNWIYPALKAANYSICSRILKNSERDKRKGEYGMTIEELKYLLKK